MPKEQTKITWIGHSSVLIELPYITILTDPVFFSRVGIKLPGLPTIWIKRFTEPALRIEELPPIDLVLISHAHMDHLDVVSLRALTHHQPYKIKCITAINTKKRLKGFQWQQVYELDWNQSLEILGLRITAGETRHRWARYPRNSNRSVSRNWAGHNSYLIEYQQNQQVKKIVFGGDTSYTHAFKQWKHKNIDVAIMPIWSYDPFLFQHCTPEESLKMAQDMNTQVFIPIHRNTFRLSKEKRREPIERLQKALKSQQSIELWLSKIGDYYRF